MENEDYAGGEILRLASLAQDDTSSVTRLAGDRRLTASPQGEAEGSTSGASRHLSALRCPKSTSGLRLSSCFSTAAEKEPSLHLPPAARGLLFPVRGEGKVGVFAIRGRSFGIVFGICAQILDAGEGRVYSNIRNKAFHRKEGIPCTRCCSPP